jgi:hypothetical protein
MSNYSNTVSNERLMLIDILNSMYNDNLRQIDTITNTLQNLNEYNHQIRNLLVQLLDNSQTNNSRQNRFAERRYRTNSSSRRSLANNTPYTIDSVVEYTVPLRSGRNTGISYTGRNNIETLRLENLFNNFMQPVEVYPTQSQIEAATRHVQYCNISRPINTQCPISMDDFIDTDMVTIIRHCGHIFHTEPLTNWFRTSCRCPVCRYDIRDYTSNASTDFFNNSENNTTTNTPSSIRSDTNESSNNNTERTYLNRIDSIGSTSSNNSYNDITSFTDASGNLLDNMLGTTSLALLLLNAINRNRNH